jgi:hypothetical protein
MVLFQKPDELGEKKTFDFNGLEGVLARLTVDEPIFDKPRQICSRNAL